MAFYHHVWLLYVKGYELNLFLTPVKKVGLKVFMFFLQKPLSLQDNIPTTHKARARNRKIL